MSSDEVPGKHLLEEPAEKNVGQGPSLSDAVTLYLRLKGQNKPSAFEATLKRDEDDINETAKRYQIDIKATSKRH